MHFGGSLTVEPQLFCVRSYLLSSYQRERMLLPYLLFVCPVFLLIHLELIRFDFAYAIRESSLGHKIFVINNLALNLG